MASVEIKADTATIKVAAQPKTNTVLLSIERPGDEGIVVFLSQALTRTLGSVLMGCAAEIKAQGKGNG